MAHPPEGQLPRRPPCRAAPPHPPNSAAMRRRGASRAADPVDTAACRLQRSGSRASIRRDRTAMRWPTCSGSSSRLAAVVWVLVVLVLVIALMRRRGERPDRWSPLPRTERALWHRGQPPSALSTGVIVIGAERDQLLRPAQFFGRPSSGLTHQDHRPSMVVGGALRGPATRAASSPPPTRSTCRSASRCRSS